MGCDIPRSLAWLTRQITSGAIRRPTSLLLVILLFLDMAVFYIYIYISSNSMGYRDIQQYGMCRVYVSLCLSWCIAFCISVVLPVCPLSVCLSVCLLLLSAYFSVFQIYIDVYFLWSQSGFFSLSSSVYISLSLCLPVCSHISSFVCPCLSVRLSMILGL